MDELLTTIWHFDAVKFPSAFNRLRAHRGGRVSTRSRMKLLFWATIVASLIGMTGLGRPIDDVLRMMRDRIRAQDVSGQTVVALIDDRAIAEHGAWPWRRHKIAQLLDTVREHGASRVFLDFPLAGTTTEADDQALAGALARWNGNAVISSKVKFDDQTRKPREILPHKLFVDVARLGNTNHWYSWLNMVDSVPYTMEATGEKRPSFAAIMSKHQMAGRLKIDYSFQLDSIPDVSTDAILDERNLEILKSKTVIIGVEAEKLRVPGGLVTASLIHVLAAETMRQGLQVELPWYLIIASLFGFALIVAVAPRRIAITVLLSSFAASTSVALWLDGFNVSASFAPAIFLFGGVAAGRGWLSYRRRDTLHNIVSGLPNLAALRDQDVGPSSAIIAVRIINYSEVAIALPQERERQLVLEIAHRLGGAAGTPIYQGDDGIFGWIIPNADASSLGDHLDALHAFFLKPIAIDSWHVDMNLAFGVDITAERKAGARFSSALLAADEAAASGARWRFYDPSKLDQAEWNVSLLSRLDTAIETGEVWVAYQPKLDLASRSIIGMEALVRWSHPDRGVIPPDQFVLAAEQQGRIDKLTFFVLDSALAMTARGRANGNDMVVAVNLSPRMLEYPALIDVLTETLARHRTPPSRLILEVTESAAIRQDAGVLAMLEAIAKAGIGLSIDDYGTGYSTLAYLKTVNAREIKIDQGFVNVMETSRSDRVLVNSTIELAHSLGRRVVAEGVETRETMVMLTDMGCDCAQGYFISRPLPEADFWQFVERSREARAGEGQRLVA